MKQISAPEEERAVIHIALNQPELFNNHLESGDFFDELNRAIWQAGRDVLAAGSPVNIVTLCDALKDDAKIRLSEINCVHQ